MDVFIGGLVVVISHIGVVKQRSYNILC
jgi:hypothetical protein